MTDVAILGLILSFIGILISFWKWVLPSIKGGVHKAKLRKKFTIEEKYEYYRQRANNPHLTYTQREHAKQRMKELS